MKKSHRYLNNLYFALYFSIQYIDPKVDQMIFKFTVDRMDPMVLALGRSAALADVLENYPDISSLCADKIKSGERYGLNKLSFISESTDCLSLFDKKVWKLLQTINDFDEKIIVFKLIFRLRFDQSN